MSEEDILHVLCVVLVFILEEMGVLLVQNLHLQFDKVSILTAVEDPRYSWYWLRVGWFLFSLEALA